MNLPADNVDERIATTLTKPEESLDPTDWDAMRALGHRMVDDVMDSFQTIRDRPVWQPIPAHVRSALKGSAPKAPQGAERAYEEFLESVFPYPWGNTHPRFWGWVNGQGTPLGAFSDMLAAAMNPNVAFGETSAVFVEEQVLHWFKEAFTFPSSASGILTSGGSMANLLGLGVAVDSQSRFDLACTGHARAPQPMVLYASEQTHYSVDKAVRLLGLGIDSLRKIPVDSEFQIDLTALREAIASDRSQGLHPFCVVGNAGTVNTGAVDDLDRIADLCVEEDLWFHIDGAFGALATLSPKLRPMLQGLERADSLAFDLHKWMYMPIEVGALLVRNETAHREAFALDAEYLNPIGGGITRSGTAFRDYGMQLTRGFRALKVWMSVKEHGTDKYARIIEQNVDHAQYLESLIDNEERLELLAPVSLNVVCFRFRDRDDETELNAINERLLVEMQEGGVLAPSHTSIGGRFALRVANTNHRTERQDFEVLVSETLRLGSAIAARGGNGTT